MAFELINHEGEPLRSWIIDDVYMGVVPTDGRTMHIARKREKVTDPDVGEYIVTSMSGNIPTLELKLKYNQQGQNDPESDSLITSLSMRQPNSTAKAFWDANQNPPTINIDGRWYQHGEEPQKMIFFLGTDTDEDTGTIISERYDANGEFVAHDVPLYAPEATLPTQKRVRTFNTTYPLKPGQIITGVAYTATGGVYSAEPFKVIPSASIRPLSKDEIFLEKVSLKSPLLSKTDPKLLLNTLNTPFNTSLLKGMLHYSDGSSVEVNIDGVKCVIHGVDRFDTGRSGMPSDIFISYYPDNTEPFINGNGGQKKHLTEGYKLANIKVDTEYTLKIYPVPRYNGAAVGYTFEWRLTNMAGDLDIDVTADVSAALADGSPLRGNNYGVVQSITLALNMDNVAPGVYPGHVHTQKMDITLTLPGTGGWSPWVIDYIGGGVNNYGVDLYMSASNYDGGKLKISAGEEVLDDWITKIYKESAPLWDVSLQSEPTTPSHFVLEYGGVEAEYTVDQYDQVLDKIAGASDFVDDQTLLIRWIYRGTSGDKILALSPVLIRVDL